MKIKRTGAEEYGRYIKALFVGEPGAGKTLIASTFPNPLYASAEGGLMSIADRNIPYIEIESASDLLGVKAALDQAPNVREEILGFPVDTVVIDTIDEIQRILIRERLKETKNENMQLQDWGWLGEQMNAIISGFRNLEANVVMTCHMKEVSDGDSGAVWFEPGLQGAIGKQIPGYFDLVLLLDTNTVSEVEDGQAVRKQVRTITAAPTTRHKWIKDRSGKLPAQLDVDFATDYDRIHELIYGDISNLPESQSEEVEGPVANTVQQAVEEVEAATEPEPAAKPEVVPHTDHKGEEKLVDTSTGEVLPAKETETEEEAPVEPPVTAFGNDEEAEETLHKCEVCDVEVAGDQADFSRIRFRKYLCRDHFNEARR